MKKNVKRLAVCLFAAVWWGIFYPELCFTEETCAAVTSEEAQANDLSVQEERTGAGSVPGAETGVSTASGQIEATADFWNGWRRICLRVRIRKGRKP